MTKVPPIGSVGPSGMSLYRQLTPRDRLLLSWLAEHYLLSTDQIARALFDSLRTAQQRLTILHRRHVLDRFVDTRADGGDGKPGTCTPSARTGCACTPARGTTRTASASNPRAAAGNAGDRIASSPTRRHLLGVNQFFVDLHHHTRHASRGAAGAVVVRAARHRLLQQADRLRPPRPPGRGVPRRARHLGRPAAGRSGSSSSTTVAPSRCRGSSRNSEATSVSPAPARVTPSCSGCPTRSGKPGCWT